MMIAIVADRTCGTIRPGDLAHLGDHAVIERDEPRPASCSARRRGRRALRRSCDVVGHYLVSLWT